MARLDLGATWRSVSIDRIEDLREAVLGAGLDGARIVRRARAYIEGNLGSRIAADALAAAIGVSGRTLCRAFADVLGDTPNGFIPPLRLHASGGACS